MSCLFWRVQRRKLSLLAGIIESDDIKEITNEIDRAVTFSNQASSLVETVKSRYKDKSGTSQKVCKTLPLVLSALLNAMFSKFF